MFSGIVQEIGIIKKVIDHGENKFFEVSCSPTICEKPLGASVAFDGTCFTIIEKSPTTITVEAIPETLKKTLSGNYVKGQKINLEPSLKLGDEISGHMVTGHIDCMSTIKSIKQLEHSQVVKVNMPDTIAHYIALKGSITINGVSLTISKLEESYFEVSLAPYTVEKTNLHTLTSGSPVNLESDMMARYIERLLDAKEGQTKYNYLVERGFI